MSVVIGNTLPNGAECILGYKMKQLRTLMTIFSRTVEWSWNRGKVSQRWNCSRSWTSLSILEQWNRRGREYSWGEDALWSDIGHKILTGDREWPRGAKGQGSAGQRRRGADPKDGGNCRRRQALCTSDQFPPFWKGERRTETGWSFGLNIGKSLLNPKIPDLMESLVPCHAVGCLSRPAVAISHHYLPSSSTFDSSSQPDDSRAGQINWRKHGEDARRQQHNNWYRIPYSTADQCPLSVIKWIGVAAGIIVLITFAAFLFVFCVLKKRKDQFMKGQSPADFGLKDESLDKDELLHADPIKNHLEPEEDSARANANASSCSGTTPGETPSAGQEVATPI